MRVMVFGASVTQGFYDTKGGWVARLWEYYTKRLLDGGKDITIFNLGISGDGSDRLVKRFENETIARKFPGEEFSFVFSIGTNNSWFRSDGSPASTPENYADDVRNLINSARRFSSIIMFLGIGPCDETRAHPVPWNKDIFFTNERLKLFDQTLANICREEQVEYLPIFEPLKKRLDAGEDIYEDGLHPNDAGHQLIFELVRPALDELLNT
jgi:lysophospholipase L1-like esterase